MEEFKLYVGGLNYETKSESIEAFFGGPEKVEQVIIIKHQDGKSKGFGFVVMKTQEDMDDAIANLNGQELDGFALTVNKARPKESRPADGQRGGYNGGNRSFDRGDRRY